MMLQISSTQFAAFQADRLKQANVALEQYLSKRFPNVTDEAGGSLWTEVVANGRARSAQFGIIREDLVASFLDLTVMYGDNFWSEDWSSDVLCSDVLKEDEKIAALHRRIEQSEQASIINGKYVS